VAKMNAKNKGRLSWWVFGAFCGIIFGSLVPSCGDFLTSSASDVAGNATEAVGLD
jgi:hypothetical protein